MTGSAPMSVLLALILVLYTGLTTAAEVPVGDDGLHKPDWLALTFRDIAEDIADASAENKRHVILFEQKGCIYCSRMHETVLLDEDVLAYLKKHYTVVQYNLYGDEEVIDLDGEVLTEKSAAAKWDIMFTPTWIFLPEQHDAELSVTDAAVGSMPGAFGKGTFLDLFTWVYDKGYEGDESFQRYHARRIEERTAAGTGGSND